MSSNYKISKRQNRLLLQSIKSLATWIETNLELNDTFNIYNYEYTDLISQILVNFDICRVVKATGSTKFLTEELDKFWDSSYCLFTDRSGVSVGPGVVWSAIRYFPS